jgi:hypothetical protein
MLLKLTRLNGTKFIIDTTGLIILPYQEEGKNYVKVKQNNFECNIQESIEEILKVVSVIEVN